MFTINNFEYDCTKKCKNFTHGNIITSNLTKRSVTDKKLASLVAKTCKNFAEVLDAEGRSALHLASSVDRYAISEWLINNGANINLKDKESGQTPLHRAIFYGCINVAVLLLRLGAKLDIYDEDFKNPLQLCCHPPGTGSKSNNYELLVWGSNKNYNLGLDNEQETHIPQQIELFKRHNISIKQISLNTYHSIFLSESGDVYTVGHGKGGRLGMENENTLVLPHKIQLSLRGSDEKIISVSAAKNHSLILTNHDVIYACGSNTYSQLGIKSGQEKVVSFTDITHRDLFLDKKFKSVIAREYHSLVFNDNEIYVWGLNGGQFGLKPSYDFITVPKQITFNEQKISLVDSSTGALVCYTAAKLLFIFNKFKMRCIKTPNLESITNISVTGGELITKIETVQKQEEVLKVLVLTESNALYIWYEDIQKYVKCIFSMCRHLDINNLIWCSKRIFFLTSGDLFIGSIVNKINCQNLSDKNDYQETYSKKDICLSNKIKIDLKRVPHVSQVVNMWSDSDGENFAVICENAKQHLRIPKLTLEDYNLKILYTDMNECDLIHDLIFHVENRTFPAHKFVIFSRARGLQEMVERYNDKSIFLNIEGLTGKMFEIILKHIYTNTFINEEDIREIHKSTDLKEKHIALATFKNIATKFGLHDLVNFFKRKIPEPMILDRSAYPELYDVTIKCAQGRELLAHKCVLISRLEYFNMMFNNSWSETREVNLSTVPLEYMEPVLEYLYSNTAEKLLSQKYSEVYLMNMLILCDQFFIESLKNVFEILLAKKLTIKKCGEILDFAYTYNCELMKPTCLEFICSNMAQVLERRCLDCLEPFMLKDINTFYRKLFSAVDYRVIVPSSNAFDDDALESFVHDFNMNLESKIPASDQSNQQKNKNKIKAGRPVKTTRDYEKEAIVLIKDFSIESPKKKKEETSQHIRQEAVVASEKILSQTESWTKVTDKKDQKRKTVAVAGLKANDILQNESKSGSTYVNLNNLVKNENVTTLITTQEPLSASDGQKITNSSLNFSSPTTPPDTAYRSIIQLGDFTPIKNGKLSQKQRKRLSSESLASPKESNKINLDLKPSTTSPITTAPVCIANAWKIPQSPQSTNSLADIMKSPKEQSKLQDHFNKGIDIPANKTKMKSLSPASSPTKMPSSVHISVSFTDKFTSILEDEKRQKEYFERQKTKPLVLTQIEETAIDDLKEFYNVENVFDESITIERRNRLSRSTMNFAVWQHS